MAWIPCSRPACACVCVYVWVCTDSRGWPVRVDAQLESQPPQTVTSLLASIPAPLWFPTWRVVCSPGQILQCVERVPRKTPQHLQTPHSGQGGCCRFKVGTAAAASSIWEKYPSKVGDSTGGYRGLGLQPEGENWGGAAPCVRWAQARLFLWPRPRHFLELIVGLLVWSSRVIVHCRELYKGFFNTGSLQRWKHTCTHTHTHTKNPEKK